MKYNWDWSIIFCTSETHFLWFFAKDDCGQAYFYWIVTGFGWTILVALAAWVIAFILGSIIGIARTVKQPVVSSADIGGEWYCQHLRGGFPQHPAPGADVHLVLRGAGVPA